MLHITTWLQSRFVREDEGATMVEYGLMVALVAVISLTAVGLLGTNLAAKFNQIAGAIN